MTTALVGEIIEDMKTAADRRHAAITARYVKTSTLTFLGLRVSQIEEITKKHTKQLSPEDLLGVMNGLWKTQILEGRLSAVSVMKTYAKTSDTDHTLSIISRWIDDLDTWALLDPLAIYCIGTLLLRDPHIERTLVDWGRSDSFWRRRASMLPYILLCRKEYYKEEYTDRILASLRPHLPDREFFVAKAVGWVLRELSKRDPKMVESFISTNRDVMARLTAREGGRRLGDPANKKVSNGES